MFRVILFTQWKWTRLLLLPIVIATFAMPVFSVQAFSDASLSRWQVSSMLGTMQAMGLIYMFLSALLGIGIAATAWSADTKGRHVYALSLPVPRWHYLLLRYAAGVVLLLVPAFSLWIGALLAVSSAPVPVGLNAYPTALAVRFLLASFVSYSVTFALSSVPNKLSLIAATAVGVLLFALSTIDYLTGTPKLMPGLFEWAIHWPGILEVFAGRWLLIDV